MDKRLRAAVFRERLTAAMEQAGLSRSALARQTGVDRSTLSALLVEGETRLPNSQLVADSAAVLGVSTDWLLGLTERPEQPGDLIAASVRIAAAERNSVDDQILSWHREANGYKIRHVPTTLPDMLKTEAVLTWEYGKFLGKTPEQALRATMDRLEWLRGGDSDYEIAVPRQEIEAFAAGEGYYRDLPAADRQAQLERLQRYCDDLYPSLRIFLFDARRLFSAPITVFGPILACVYVGKFYLAFRGEDRVRSISGHFDWLVRECDIDARETPAYLGDLLRRD